MWENFRSDAPDQFSCHRSLVDGHSCTSSISRGRRARTSVTPATRRRIHLSHRCRLPWSLVINDHRCRERKKKTSQEEKANCIDCVASRDQRMEKLHSVLHNHTRPSIDQLMLGSSSSLFPRHQMAFVGRRLNCNAVTSRLLPLLPDATEGHTWRTRSCVQVRRVKVSLWF